MDGCSYGDMISACHLPSFSFCDDSSVYYFQALNSAALPEHYLLCAASNPPQFLPPDPPPPPPRPGFLTPEKDLSLSSIIVCPARCPLAEPTVVVVPLLSPSIAAPAMVVLGQQRSKAKGRSCQESSDSRELARSKRTSVAQTNNDAHVLKTSGKKANSVARGIIHLDEQVWPGACNLSSCLEIPHAVLLASRHVLMRNLSLPSSRHHQEFAFKVPADDQLGRY